ncbi:MAG TPA: GNAT family N-acetyltransferase, partial [Candidatus Limnocylindria bacterium]|nr:GNAT family N-acetyltransferase [Candidatus Limnocylindria bacterium]
MAGAIAIRAPHEGDLAAMADQAAQLGYPVEPDELRRRLAGVTAGQDAAVLVAIDAADQAIGWLHVELKQTLVAPLSAQIMALVVDEGARGAGAGKALVDAAARWAAARG